MTTHTPIPRRGYVYVAASALLWGISGSCAKFLFQQGMTPYQLVQIRVTLAAALLFLWLQLRRSDLLRISRGDILYLAVLGCVGMAMLQFTYFLTISKIKVAAAILLEYLAPIFIALYATLFAHERLAKPTLLAMFGATAGCYLVVGGYNLDLLALNREGVLCGILSALAFAWYSVHGERGMRRYHPWTVLFYALLFSALFWNGAHLLWSAAPVPLEFLWHPYPISQWAWLFYIAILGTILPFGLYFEGINLIRSTRASITAILEPITAGVISYLFLGETLEPLQMAGVLLAITSLVLVQLRREYDDKTPEILRSSGQITESI